MNTNRRGPRGRALRSAQPGLLTGTSSEFTGRRAAPRLLQERAIVCVLGPSGVGKSFVVSRLVGAGALVLDARACQAALVAQVSKGRWSSRLLQAEELVLDGPVWLDRRPAALEAYVRLLSERFAAGRRTYVVQSDADGSLSHLVARMEPGSTVVLGLRFPVGRRGQARFAARYCDHLGITRDHAKKVAQLEPWSYAAVKDLLTAAATDEAKSKAKKQSARGRRAAQWPGASQASQLAPER